MHAWEDDVHPWEQSSNGNSDSDSDGDEDAGTNFTEMLLEMLFANKISAKSLCVLCWWASRAGVAGPASEFAKDPRSQTGKFQRHIDRVLNVDMSNKSYMHLGIPGHSKYDVSRTVHSTPVVAPHDAISREVAANPELLVKLRTYVDGDKFAACYRQHPVVQSVWPQRLVLPLLLYVDGVPFLKKDSMTGFYLFNPLSGIRHLLVALRKSYLCKCGCRGWCSLWPVWRFIAWSLGCLAAGIHPNRRWDGHPWGPGETEWLAKANVPLNVIGALLHIKGDWSEFATSFGFASWSSTDYPCMHCWSSGADHFNPIGVSPLGLPWEPVTDDDLDAACKASERVVTLTCLGDMHQILTALRYDKRPKGVRGRRLIVDMPHFNLQVDDRLEPCDLLDDVSQFEMLTQFPCQVLFWRSSEETRVRHRNPLMSSRLGVGIHSFAIDQLHCLNLGVLQEYCCAAMWLLIESDVWGVGAALGFTDRLVLSVMRLKGEIFAWYDRRRITHRAEVIYPLKELTPEMLGTRKKNRYGLKRQRRKPSYTQCLRSSDCIWISWRRARYW
jgi:hypothetical protein